MKKHIEAYLFIPFRGQYRFSLELTPKGEGYSISNIQDSNRKFDYFWDMNMRHRPTCNELTNPDSEIIYRVWKNSIFGALSQAQEQFTKSPNSVVKKTLPAHSYIEFVNVKEM